MNVYYTSLWGSFVPRLNASLLLQWVMGLNLHFTPVLPSPFFLCVILPVSSICSFFSVLTVKYCFILYYISLFLLVPQLTHNPSLIKIRDYSGSLSALLYPNAWLI